MEEHSSTRKYSIVKALLLVVLAGIIGATGYYVYDANRNIKAALSSANKVAQDSAEVQTAPKVDKVDEEAQSWELVTSLEEGFSIRIPGGWEGANYGESDSVRIVSTDYEPGAPAVIEAVGSPYAGDSQVPFSVTILDDTPEPGQPAQQFATPEGEPTPFKAGELSGIKYTQVYEEDTDQGVGQRFAGDTDYTYWFDLENGNVLMVHYSVSAEETNQVELIERVIATIDVK